MEGALERGDVTAPGGSPLSSSQDGTHWARGPVAHSRPGKERALLSSVLMCLLKSLTAQKLMGKREREALCKERRESPATAAGSPSPVRVLLSHSVPAPRLAAG